MEAPWPMNHSTDSLKIQELDEYSSDITEPNVPHSTKIPPAFEMESQSPILPHWLQWIEWLLILGMLIILSAPVTGKILKWPPVIDLNENRQLAPLPGIVGHDWHRLPHAIDQWWNDHFAFRTQLIPLREAIWLDLLDAPGKQYVRGLEGHLFLNPLPGEKYHGDQNPTVFDYLGFFRLNANQVLDWIDYLEGKNAWLRAHGIHYLFVIAPNKITVENRYLPSRIRNAKGKTYLEQLREQVFPKLTSQVDLLDLTPILTSIEQETGRPMFSKTHDVAHWNGDGFREGLLAMDKHLRINFPDMPLFPTDMLNLSKSDTDPTFFSCKWENDPTIEAVDEYIFLSKTGYWADSKCSRAAGRKGRLLLFSDSSWKCFCGGLEIFLPGTHTAFPYQWEFHRHAAIQHVTFNELERSVLEDKPDVVVEAQTERALSIPPEIGIPDIFRVAARYARGKTIFSWNSPPSDELFEKHTKDTEIDRTNGAIHEPSNPPTIIASHPIDIPNDSQTAICCVDIEAPASGTFLISWSTDNGFCHADSTTTILHQGRNVFFQTIPLVRGKTYLLRFTPITDGGTCAFRRIEIRTAPAMQ